MIFQNKTALVTGAARDIGKAIAVKLASEGARVIIHYSQSEQAAKQTLEEIKNAKGEATLFKADLTKSDEVVKLRNFCEQQIGNRLDILVNNCGGIIGRKKLVEHDEAFFDAVMDLNFKSLFLVTRAFVDMLPSGGCIVNMSSLRPVTEVAVALLSMRHQKAPSQLTRVLWRRNLVLRGYASMQFVPDSSTLRFTTGSRQTKYERT